MQLFFFDNLSDTITIQGDEARHLSKVLRKKIGDVIEVTDGKGNGYFAEISGIGKDELEARIIKPIQRDFELKTKVHLLVAPTKNADRIEWMVEKTVELGVYAITPVFCERSERKNCNTDRLKKIAMAAMKQSGRFLLPVIHEPVKLSQLQAKEEQKLVAHCMETGKTEISKVPFSDQVALLIGPEGDFTEKEISHLTGQGWIPVSLGNSRLRTETAAIFGIAAIRAMD